MHQSGHWRRIGTLLAHWGPHCTNSSSRSCACLWHRATQQMQPAQELSGDHRGIIPYLSRVAISSLRVLPAYDSPSHLIFWRRFPTEIRMQWRA